MEPLGASGVLEFDHRSSRRRAVGATCRNLGRPESALRFDQGRHAEDNGRERFGIAGDESAVGDPRREIACSANVDRNFNALAGGLRHILMHAAHLARPALRHQVGLPGAVATGRNAGFNARRSLAVRRKKLDDTAGIVALDRRHRAAHDLHGLGAIEVEGRRLALAIGHRNRDAVPCQTYAVQPEGGAGAEATRGNL